MILSLNTSVLPNVRLICSVAYREPWTHFPRTTDEYILYIVKSGELYITEGETDYSLKSGDLLLLRPNVLHKGFRPSCCEYYYIHFKHDHIRAVEDQRLETIIQQVLFNRNQSMTENYFLNEKSTESICYIPNFYHLKNEVAFFHSLNDFKENYFVRLENYRELASCKLLEILIKVGREFISNELKNNIKLPKVYIKVHSVINYINSNYQKKITSPDIEKLFETNFDYINRAFHKLIGYSIFNYLNKTRINRSKELIETTPMKFSEVGYLVGIDDPYYFSKLFKKYTGITPTEYAKINNFSSRT